MSDRILIFGAGYSGKAFARANPGGAVISGTTRSPEKFAALEASGILPLSFDGADISPDLAGELERTTHLVISAGPDEAGDPVLNATGDVIRGMKNLRWIGYLSTVGVYGDHQGGWVDETAECRPMSKRSMQRVAAENAWLDLRKEIGKPVALLRLSGIYGPGRNAFVNLHNGTARRLIKEGQVFNRIHVDDIAGALWTLLTAERGGIFNVTDDLPAPPQDVVAYVAELMKIAPPPEISFETAQLSPMARSFYGENKRVSNAAIKAEGYSFRHPNYRAALESMWQDGSWQGLGESDARTPIKA
ncbi:SDR family oxidoreductase [Mesorhizobium sp. SB112]|uniref:SDR family oxidoreductase n=1 Tax=Mesorhizobium sp. SB112 TaxID=3151853 RepID=UPI00326359EB